MPISRRKFAQLLGAGTAGTLVTISRSPAASVTARPSATAGVVRLSSNENPYGPCQKALKAMHDAFSLAWRYPDEHADLLIDSLAKLNGVGRDQILLGDGSGEILKLCAEVFTGPISAKTSEATGRGTMVVADPTFEAIFNHARVNGAEVVKVPLNKRDAHDLPRMLAAAREGLIYICNPNNPTASITPKEDMRAFISKVPPQTMVLVDEADFH